MCDGDGIFKHPPTVFMVARRACISHKLLVSARAVFPLEMRQVSFGFAGARENKCLWLPSDFTVAFPFLSKFDSAALHSPGRYPAPCMFLC